MDGALIKGENKVMKLKEKLHKLKMMMMMDPSRSISSTTPKSTSNASTGSSR
jgi:hypothetical protein